MFKNDSRSSWPVTWTPLPSRALLLVMPEPPKDFASGRVHRPMVTCPVEMEIDPSVVRLAGATVRTRNCGADLRSPPPPSIFPS